VPIPLRAIAIFALTYVLVSGARWRWLPLGRPGGALLGAVLMVLCGVLTPAAAYAAVNVDTIVLLLGTMILSEFLRQSGFYGLVAARLDRAALSPGRLLGVVSLAAAVLSAFLVNDTVCLMLTPFVVAFVRAAGLPPVPYLMALATSSNVGSALTLTGNPQNMVIGTLSEMPYLRFSAVVLVPVALAFAANLALLRWRFRAELRAAVVRPHTTAEVTVDGPLLRKSLACLALAVAGFATTRLTGLNLAWTALAAAALLLVLARRDPHPVFGGIDGTLLLFFAGLFVVIGGLESAGILKDLEQRFARPLLGESVERQTLHLTWLTVAGSQIFSNVPYVIVAGDWVPGLAAPELGWAILGFASTVAGNLTILGSVANVIVLEQARGVATIGFWEYLRFGALTTTASLVLGVATLLLEHRLGWI
jgi:Na+/H+ antiporter NhaD/arsenite permease-like protein